MNRNLPSIFARALASAAAVAVALGFLGRPAQAEPPTQDQHATSPRPDKKQVEAQKFLRFKPDPAGGGTLETSIVRYANDEGDTVDLIGAVHVGDRAYYDLLNERFKNYDALLYEMVKPRDADMSQRESGGGLS